SAPPEVLCTPSELLEQRRSSLRRRKLRLVFGERKKLEKGDVGISVTGLAYTVGEAHISDLPLLVGEAKELARFFRRHEGKLRIGQSGVPNMQSVEGLEGGLGWLSGTDHHSSVRQALRHRFVF